MRLFRSSHAVCRWLRAAEEKQRRQSLLHRQHPRRKLHSEPVGGTYGGEVMLIDVDEKTAACIMAIVSHETGIPLSELIFKKIKAL